MPEINFDVIQPLVESTDSSGYGIQVVFRCPVSGEEIRSSAQVVQDQKNAIASTVKSSFWRSMRYSLGSVVRSVFGYGVAGQIGSSLAYSAVSGSGSGFKPSEAQLKQAVVDAFKNVSNRFAWDGTNQRFVSVGVYRELMTEFQVVLQSVQITKDWDRHVLARMLAEVSAADGQVDESERAFFYSFTGGEGPTLDDLLSRPPLNRAELEEVSKEVGGALYMLAAAVAFSDQNIDANESAKLDGFGAGLGLSAADQQRAQGMAREFIVDQALEGAYADGRVDEQERAEVIALAGRLGVPEDRVNRLDVRCRKRKGIL